MKRVFKLFSRFFFFLFSSYHRLHSKTTKNVIQLLRTHSSSQITTIETKKMTESGHFHRDIEQHTYYEERLKNKDIRSMPVGNERLAALRDLGATFDEGQHRTTKIATPSGTPKLPTFVDASQIEVSILLSFFGI